MLTIRRGTLTAQKPRPAGYRCVRPSCRSDVDTDLVFSMFPGAGRSRRERLSAAMQHVSVACRQDPRTAPGRVATDGLRRRTRPPPPRRKEYRVVRPAVRRFQSGTRPDSGHVARRARKPATACREGEGRTAARRQHQARAVPLATRRPIGARHLDAVLSFFQVFTMCSGAADTLT